MGKQRDPNRQSWALHKEDQKLHSPSASFMKGNSSNSRDSIHSFPSCLSTVIGSSLFCIVLLTKRKESWVGNMKGKKGEEKLTTEEWKIIHIEKVVLMKNRIVLL